MNSRKVVLYIAMSLDGFIATKDDDISWLSLVEKEGEDYGYSELTKRFDTYIVGRTTYEKVLELTGGKFPQSERFNCYVITHQDRKPENGITFYNQDIEALIKDLKSKEGKDIYCDGGGQIVKLLMERNLIDEYIITIIPTILGDGKRLFMGGVNRIAIKGKAPIYYDTGVVQLNYIKKQEHESEEK